MDSDNEALALIRGLNWERWDYDSCQIVESSVSLSTLINDLAFLWGGDAPNAVLSLLAKGELQAIGEVRWQKFQDESFRKFAWGLIPNDRWVSLQERLANVDPFKGSFVTFFSLEINDQEKHPLALWDWQNDRFESNWAQGDPWEVDHFEESFSASNICIMPPPSNSKQDRSQGSSYVVTDRNRGGAPIKYDWEKAVAALVFKWADSGGWEPVSQANVKNALADWFAEQGDAPSDSELKKRARWLFPMFQSRNVNG